MIKKYLLIGLLLVSTLTLLSWGFIGHQTVARIAENHLSPQAKAAVHDLLGPESIVDVASWADQVRSQPEYKPTGGWHYVDLDLGLSYTAFDKAVKAQGENCVYGAILKQEEILKDATASKAQKAIALKFLVHFIGDAHQPMHVSRAEDKGGNTVQVQFDGKGTNLHALWDSRLIDHQALGYAAIAAQDDKATPAEIRQWQSAPLMQWLWESYQITTKLYAGVERNNKLDETYYKDHIGIINDRLEKGGIRLAGVLNELFSHYTPAPAASTSTTPVAAAAGEWKTISAEDAARHVGEQASITAKVYGYKELGSLVLVNVGAAYPNQLLTVVLRSEAKTLAARLEGKTITVRGTLIDFKGKPEIEVRNITDIQVHD